MKKYVVIAMEGDKHFFHIGRWIKGFSRFYMHSHTVTSLPLS